ncbi:MAG: uroporphyrinogen-III C-methyltransferase [Candidatus Didemnitutus sp.]|nr:uroporphyrinogen-III C-methyltransferase [Candidatus Didemnitutus sp.]
MFKSTTAGNVTFVGAGPGAADLITVRGLCALQQADVVLHDDLANRELLGNCRHGTEFIYVGKRAGTHSALQEEINWLLVAHASAGRRVVRLKGGDPTVFGRLGEEIAALRAAQIAFEIVPGITAACASAAAAGISLTQRGVASTAILTTGHECEAKRSRSVDWSALAHPGATLCVYMGTRRLGEIAERLTAHGISRATPLLIVSHASRPTQSIRLGTLESAAQLATELEDTPSLIVIGEAAAAHRSPLATAHAQEPAHASH